MTLPESSSPIIQSELPRVAPPPARAQGAARHVTFYHQTTGLLNGLSIVASDHDAIALNTPADHVAIDHPDDRQLDHLSERFDLATGKIVEHQPPQPSPDHEWDAAAKRWRLNQATQDKQARRQGALKTIAALETAQHRPLRDLALDPQNLSARSRLESIAVEIAALRADIA